MAPPPPPPSQALPPHIIARQSRQPQLFITNKRPNVNRPPLGLNHTAPQQPNPSLNLNSFSIPDSSDLLEATRRQVAADNASQGRPFWTTATAKRPADDNMAFNFGQQASGAGASGSAPATSGANDGGSIFGQSKTTAGSLFGRDTNAPTSGFGATPASNAGGLFGNANNSQAKPAGGFSFGQATGSTPASGTATPSAQPPSLFGGNSGTSGGMFGGSNNNASANPFGSSTAGSSAPAAGGIFGAKPAASLAATPGEQPKAGGMFGGGAPASNTGGSLFGAAAAGNQPSWSFGQNAPAADQNKSAPTQSVFGQSSSTTTPADKPLFGAITPQNSKTAPPSFTPAGNPPSTSLFGGAGKQKENEPASNQPPQGGSLFGAKPAATQAPAFQFPGTAPTQSSSTPQSNNGGLFAPKTNAQGPNATTSATSSLFSGAAQPQQSSSAAPASSAPAAGGLFSNLNQPGGSAPAQSASQGLFSGASGFKLPGAPASSTTNQPAAATTSAPAPSFSFPTAGQTTSSASAQPASTTAPAPSFSFTQPTPSTTSQTPAAAPAPAASSGGGLFGATAPAPAASGAGGSGGLFSGAAAPAASNAGGSSGGLFGAPASSQPAPAASSGAPAGGLFSNPAPATSQSTTTAAPAAPSLAATASTTGPAPPQQSRLAAKSMDEILTMWSTSLATHQKTFQQLAQRVSVWDRQLVENSSKISALYGRCFQAERDCSEVERQLGNVEHGQVELEALLDRYEGEVDRMMEGSGFGNGSGGGGAGGVDGERERTYKTAESCSNRLTEMHHSLTSMIEEINVSSSSLSAANGGSSSSRNQPGNKDPLADIVTILNGHLSQLQAIDQGAAALQGKVLQAQREARGLSERSGIGGGRGEWVEGFGRSYLGRR
ncbi:FG-nucleoporin nsp1 [Recurvomyces mirabilis]|nr:FG-nucleoporin nsp1 [Recurvomyces mirabilis]